MLGTLLSPLVAHRIATRERIEERADADHLRRYGPLLAHLHSLMREGLGVSD